MRKRIRMIALLLPALALLPSAYALDAPPAAESKSNVGVKGWPGAVQAVNYLSAADNTRQPTLFYKPPGDKRVPLLVALHTWSSDYLQPQPAYAKWCITKGWAFVHPNFRGPNNTPEACGSEWVVQDILSAVEYAKQNANIDPDRIYLMGGSGGAYAAMLMAGRAPQVWAGVSAWCGIFDLRDWYDQTSARKLKYAEYIARSCGGIPGASAEVDAQYRLRSASTYLAAAQAVPIDLNTGIFDGHRGSVPTSHSLDAFNILAAPGDRVATADIAFITKQAKIPEALRLEINDPWYSQAKALWRKTSGNTRVTVFEGGHDILFDAGLSWLEQQRKGKPAVWHVPVMPGVNRQDQPVEVGK
jgi:acetyl esterase/lipase